MIIEIPYNSNIWLAPHFRAKEFQCKCGRPHKQYISTIAVAWAEFFRCLLNVPVYVNSACRCVYWNKIKGGVYDSQHLFFNALDLDTARHNGKQLLQLATGVSYKYCKDEMLHVDFRYLEPHTINPIS